MGLVSGTVSHYCLGGCSALVVCARRSRPVRGGWGWCRVLCLLHFPLPAPRFTRCVWWAVPSGCPLSSLAGTTFHAVCAFRGLGPVALLIFPACPLRVRALALSRRPRPSPLPGSASRTHLARSRGWAAVGRFHAVRAPPRVLPRSHAPFGLLGGGGGAARSRSPPAWLGVVCPPWGTPQRALLRAGFARRGGGTRAPGGMHLLPVCGAFGVRRSPSPDRSSFGACCRGPLPTGCGCGGCGRGNPSPTPQRALLQAGFVRCGGGTRGPGGGATCLGVGLPRSGALQPPTARPLGRADGAHNPLAVGAGVVGVGTRHQPHSAHSCEQPLRAVGWHEGARAGRLLLGRGAFRVGRCPTPDRASFGACGRGPLPTGCGCGVRGVWARGPVTNPQRALASWLCALWGRHEHARGGASCLGVGRLGSGALPTPTARPSGRAAGAHYPLAVGGGGAGMGARHRTHNARACELALRAVGAAPGRPGRAPLACLWSVRCWALSQPRPLLLWGVRPGPTTHWLWVRRVRAWGLVTNPTTHAHASWLCVLWGRHTGVRGGRLLPGCGASGVGRSPTHDRSFFWGVLPGPTTHWLWVRGMRAWGPVTNPTTPTPASWLCVLWGLARGRLGGGASCLCVGRPGSGALPSPTARPLGRAARVHYPLAVGAGGVDVGTRHRPHSARSCKLALRAVGAARGRPGGGSCLSVGRPGSGAFPPPTARSLGRASGAHYPLAVGARGSGVGTRHQPHRARSCELALRPLGAAPGCPGGAPLASVWAVRFRALSHPRPLVLWGVRPGPTTHWLWVWRVQAWGLVNNPTARALASWLCVLWGWHKAAQGGAPLAWAWGVQGRALSHPRPLVLWGVRPGPATHWLWVRCAGMGARLSLAPSPVPRFVVRCARFPGLRHPVAVVAWHLSSCRGCGRRQASLACTVAPRWCAVPRPVRSLSVLRLAFPSPWCLPPTRGLLPPALLGGCAGHAGLCRGNGAGRAPRGTRSGPRNGVVTGGSLRLRSWAACAAVVRRVWTRSLTRPVSRTVHLSTGDSADAPGLFRVDANTSPFRSENATHGSCACVCACSSWTGRAGRPPGRVLVRLTFLCGRSLCALCLLGPLRAGAALFAVVSGFFFSFSFFFCFFCAPAVSGVPCFPARDARGLGVLWSSGPPLLFFFLFFSSFAPPFLLRSLVPSPGCRGPWRAVVLPRGPPLCFSFFPSSSPPPPSLLSFSFFCFFLSFFRFCLFAFCPLFFPCPSVPVVRFSRWFVCPGLWGVLVCVAVSLGGPWLCLFCVCFCLSICGVVVRFVLCLVLCGVPVLGLVLAPCCCPLLPSPGPLSWPVVVSCPGVRCCVALACRLLRGVLLWCRVVLFALAGAVWCCLWLLAVRCWVL